MIRLGATELKKTGFVCFQDLIRGRGQKGWWSGDILYVCVCVCLYVCVCVLFNIYIFIYIYICVFVCIYIYIYIYDIYNNSTIHYQVQP